MYIRPLSVPATIRIANVAPTSTWLRSRLRSTIGADTRFSTTTKSTAPTIEARKHASVATDVQPQSPPLLNPRTSGTRAAAIRAVPA